MVDAFVESLVARDRPAVQAKREAGQAIHFQSENQQSDVEAKVTGNFTI